MMTMMKIIMIIIIIIMIMVVDNGEMMKTVKSVDDDNVN